MNILLMRKKRKRGGEKSGGTESEDIKLNVMLNQLIVLKFNNNSAIKEKNYLTTRTSFKSK